MVFALELTDLLPGFIGGTGSIILAFLEALLAAILLLALALWIIEHLTTRNDPPHDPLDFS